MWRDMSESWLGVIGHAEREDFALKNASTARTSRSPSLPLASLPLASLPLEYRRKRAGCHHRRHEMAGC
jgi:hypothetical protein